MISIFGIVSIAIALTSVAAILLHHRVMVKRTPVDTYLTALEDLLRRRVEALYSASPPDTELHALCAQCIDLDFGTILKAMPDIDMAFETEAGDVHTGEPEDADAAVSDLARNAQAIQETTMALNQAIEAYNRYIKGPLPVALMALVLGLTKEEFY